MEDILLIIGIPIFSLLGMNYCYKQNDYSSKMLFGMYFSVFIFYLSAIILIIVSNFIYYFIVKF